MNELLAGTGAVAIVATLAAWLGKVSANRILEKDRTRYETQMQTLLEDLRKRSGKELFVHRLQFEKEFAVYLDLWKKVLRAGRAGIPFQEIAIDTGASHDDLVGELCQACNALKDIMYDYRPFYVSDVYDLAKRLLDRLQKLHHLVATPQGFDKRRDCAENLMAGVNDTDVPQLCEAIRRRVFPEIVAREAIA